MKKFLKIFGSVVGGILVLILAAGIVMYLMGKSKLDKHYDYTPVISTVNADSTAIARGAHVLAIEACRHCHGEDLSGQVLVDAPPFRLVASNLTSGAGGVGARYTVADWDRAIRSGVAKDGHGMLIMPSEVYKNLSDEDAESLIAYLQQVEPVDNELPKRELRPLGYVMMSMSDSPTNAFAPGEAPATTPEHAPTAALGEYLSSTSCAGCHGVALDGNGVGGDPDSPPPPSLAAASAWSLDEFKTTLRTGVNPGGRSLQDQFMPWSAFKYMTDIEIEALHVHIKQTFASD